MSPGSFDVTAADPAQRSPASSSNDELRIVLFAGIGHLLTHVWIHLFTPLRRAMESTFDLEVDEFTACAATSMVLFGVGALPAGWLGDRYGERPILVAFFALCAVGGAVVGWAPDTPWLIAGFALLGAGLSIYHPVALAWISKGVSRPGRAMGWNGLFGSLGTALSPVYSATTADWTGDWRMAYLLLTVPTALLAFALALTPIHRRRADLVRSPRAPDLGGNGSSRVRLAFLFAVLLAAMTCGGVYFGLATTPLPLWLGASGVVSEAPEAIREGLIAGFVLAVGGIGQVVAGMWVERREGRGPYVFVLAAALPAMALTALLDGWGRVIAASLMTFFAFSVQPIENTLLARYTPPEWRGLAFGLKFVVVFGAGMGAGTALTGVLEAWRGTQAVYGGAAVGVAASLVFACIAFRTRLRPGQLAREGPVGKP